MAKKTKLEKPKPPVMPDEMDGKYRGKAGAKQYKKDRAAYEINLIQHRKKMDEYNVEVKKEAEYDLIRKRVETQKAAEIAKEAAKAQRAKEASGAVGAIGVGVRGFTGFPAQSVALLQGAEKAADDADFLGQSMIAQMAPTATSIFDAATGKRYTMDQNANVELANSRVLPERQASEPERRALLQKQIGESVGTNMNKSTMDALMTMSTNSLQKWDEKLNPAPERDYTPEDYKALALDEFSMITQKAVDASRREALDYGNTLANLTPQQAALMTELKGQYDNNAELAQTDMNAQNRRAIDGLNARFAGPGIPMTDMNAQNRRVVDSISESMKARPNRGIGRDFKQELSYLNTLAALRGGNTTAEEESMRVYGMSLKDLESVTKANADATTKANDATSLASIDRAAQETFKKFPNRIAAGVSVMRKKDSKRDADLDMKPVDPIREYSMPTTTSLALMTERRPGLGMEKAIFYGVPNPVQQEANRKSLAEALLAEKMTPMSPEDWSNNLTY